MLKVAYITLLANPTYCIMMKKCYPETYKTMEMSFVVVCGKMGQEEDVAQESKVKRTGSTGYTQTKRSDER